MIGRHGPSSFFGLGGRVRPSETHHPPPAWSGAVDATPIHAWLDAAKFPWRDTRAALAARYGQGKDPTYSRDVVWVASDPPLLQGLIRPIFAPSHNGATPSVPPAAFVGCAYFGEDGRENVRRTAAQLAPHLGTVRQGDEGNTFTAAWSFGPAKVTLRSWPKDLSTSYAMPRVEAHRRERRLIRGCHVIIETGWRASVSDVERAWLQSFQPLTAPAEIKPGAAEAMRNRTATDHGLEFVRLLPETFEHLVGQVGVSADRKALLIVCGQLSIVPISRVEGLRVTQTRPGRSSGSEVVAAVVQSDGAASPTIDVPLVSRDVYIGDMDEVGRALAARLGLACEVVDAGEDNY